MGTGQPETKLPLSRINFRQLLAHNPNYFGNFPESKLKPIEEFNGNTNYEAITCIGLNQARDQLEATVAIKRPLGYGGSLCGSGTREYVRFFIDYDDKTGFQDLGIASFLAHDIPNANDCRKFPEKPLYYTVTLDFLPQKKFCRFEVLPLIRGILSWNNPPPPDPEWKPVWGNALDQNVQIPPGFLFLKDIINFLPKDALPKLPPSLPELPPHPIPLPDPPPVDIAALSRKYGSLVATHRFGFPALHNVLGSAIGQDEILSLRNSWSKLKLNIDDALKEVENLNGNAAYEELNCLGLEYNYSRLVATFKVKLSSGYSGGLCQRGSTEFVTFWADWHDTCEWINLGTVKTQVHDISSVPKDGLAYSAVLPVNLASIQRSCDAPLISRIRAVLSWNVPSSSKNADEVPYWGNILDAHVQIPPGFPGNIPIIYKVGGVALDDIDTAGNGLTKSDKDFFAGGRIDSMGRICPFGRRIVINGVPPEQLPMWYRIWVRPAPIPGQASPPATFLTNTFQVHGLSSPLVTVTPDAGTGFTPYRDLNANPDHVLQWWQPLGNDLWEFKLETATQPTPGTWNIYGSPTPWYKIQLDNHSPTLSLLPISIPSCGDITIGDELTGTFSVQDDEDHLGQWSLGILPSGTPPLDVNPINPPGDTTPRASGTKWTLDTTGMKACGYTVQLHAWDRAILNSGPGSGGNRNVVNQGFCLRAKGGASDWDKCDVLD